MIEMHFSEIGRILFNLWKIMTEKFTRNELIKLVRKISDAAGTEEEIDGWVNILEKNVPDPNVSDLIFYSEEEMSAEEIVDKALSYKPIQS